MKFVSKYSNYRITLTPGIPGNALLGNPPRPAIYIKFEDGVVNVDNIEHIAMIKQHPAFLRGDFVEAQEDNTDPYKDNRREVEPEHIVSQMEHGVVKTLNPKKGIQFTPEQKKEIKKLLEEGINEGVKAILEKQNKDKETEEISDLDINEVSSDK